jgi:outer membrane protein assembly factor BamE (lipoprotein component of BamABCDE complex)
MIKYLFIAALVLTMSACATRGTPLNMADADSLQPGAKYTDVVAKLGQPLTVMAARGNTTVAVWSYVSVTPVGAKQQNVSYQFDADGLMIKRLVRTDR